MILIVRPSRLLVFALAFLSLALFVPGCARAPRRVPMMMPPAGVAVPGFYHTVQRGQTLYRIAKTYNQDWHELMAMNHIGDPSHLETGRQIFIPQQALSAYASVQAGPLTLDGIRQLVDPKNNYSNWRTITVHHSGTLQGGAKSFDRNHLQRHMGGLFYHFVIGNGTNTPEGALEVGWRWKEQVKANRPYDIQICLVGDFNQQWVSDPQFSTLVQLVQVLREEYDIPVGSVRRHEDIQGKRTECPGRHFPFQRLINELIAQDAFSHR